MPAPQLQMEVIRAAALVLLANAAATHGHPLEGVNVPAHRFGNVMSEKWPVLKVRVTQESGEGQSHETPEYEITGTLQVGGIVGGPRAESPDLDRLAAGLAAAVQTTLLEDPAFLALFAWSPRCQVTIDDDTAVKAGGAELDIVFFEVEIDVAFRQTFEPRDPEGLSAQLLAIFESIINPPSE